jgi:hypothetical protein
VNRNLRSKIPSSKNASTISCIERDVKNLESKHLADITVWDFFFQPRTTLVRGCVFKTSYNIIIVPYFSPCSVSFVLIGEYIQYSPLIIPSNIHLQCLCSTKNETENNVTKAIWP